MITYSYILNTKGTHLCITDLRIGREFLGIIKDLEVLRTKEMNCVKMCTNV